MKWRHPLLTHAKGAAIMATTEILCLTCALLLADHNSARAQDDQARHGFWMDAALGDGLARLSSDTLAGRNRNGIDFIWDFGWTFSSRVRAGIGVDQWTSRWGAGDQTWLTSFNFSVYCYPVAHRTLFLQAGAGSSDYSVVHVPWQFLGADRADTVYLSGSAWGATGAVGWDAPLGRGLSLRPRVSYSYGSPRTLRAADGTLLATGWKQHWLSVDVGIVLHPRDSW